MALPWVRLDTGIVDNPKILHLIDAKQHRAINVYLFSLAYCGRHELDGFIPNAALSRIHGTRQDAETLLEIGLWHTEVGGYKINDWAEYQPTSDQTKARRQRAQANAAKRWNNPK